MSEKEGYEETKESGDMPKTYSPSMNSGIFGFNYTSYQPLAYSPSMNSGIFGSYFDRVPVQTEQVEIKEESKEDVDQQEGVTHYEYKPAKTISKEYRDLYTQYTKIEYNDKDPIKPVNKNIKQALNGMKMYSRMTGKTFIKVEEHDYNKSGILNTIGLDVEANTFDKNSFIKKYCNLYGLHASQLNIVSVQSGSCIIEVYISNNEHYQVDLRQITEMVATDDRLNEKLREMKAFCLMFDPPTKKPGWEARQSFRHTVVFNSQYDRIYGPGNITWVGNLQDGKNRGGKPYYCPIGWFKRAVAYKFYTATDFDNKFSGWPIVYHGTTFEFGMSMLLSGFVPSNRGCYAGDRGGVYVTPSITYAAVSRYAKPKQIPNESKQYLRKFGDGNWIQFVFQCRLNLSQITHIDKKETIGATCKVDPNFSDNELEWIIGDNSIIQNPTDPNCGIYIVGLMIRVTRQHPKDLPESRWWPTWCKNIV